MRSWWPLWLAMVLGAGLPSLSLAEEADPVIGEKPLSELVKQLRSENKGLQLRAAQALAKAPAELRPQIVPKLLPVLKSERENDKFAAAQVLGEYGPPAKAAVPDLVPMLEGTQYERNRAAAAKALGQILKDAKADEEVEKVAQALIARFTDKYADVRRESVTACGTIGPAAKACLPHVPPLLREDVLGHAGYEGYGVRCAAAWAVGRMGGENARVHLDLFISLLHTDGRVNPAIPETIGIIGPVNENVVKNLVDAIESNDRPCDWVPFKVASMNALARCGPKAAPAVPFLIRNLQQHFVSSHWYTPPDEAAAIFRALEAIGPAAKDAAPAIKKYTELKEGGRWSPQELAEVQKAAAAALAAVTAKPPEPAK